MDFGLFDFLNIAGALAFFIYGMKIMSEGIQRAAGSKLRNILRTMTKNRVVGVFSGFLVTAFLQSSSATTVMVVSFANAGLLTLVESIGVIMGANIGTTVTAWLIAIFGFKMKISAFALPLIAIALPLTFFKRDFAKNVGETILGFAILFMGLALLKDAVPDLKNNPEVLNFLSSWTNYGRFSVILFTMVGTVLTIIIQSSSAAMALTLALLFAGVLPFEVAAAMVLGENIGTTITANIAALVGNVHAKRAARAHFIFNVVGVIWMVALFPFFIDFVKSMWEPFQQFLLNFIPDLDKEQEELQLSLFHTTFNIINTFMMLGFVNVIARVVTKLVPSTGDEDDAYRLEYIGNNIKTPELSILELQKEVAKFGEVTGRMSGFTRNLIRSTESKVQNEMLERLAKYEEITDRFEIELTEYLTKLSRKDITPTTSVRIRSIMNICNDLERIGDVFFQMSKTVEQKIANRTWFDPNQHQRLNEMFDLIDEAFVVMIENLQTERYDDVEKDKALMVEEQINKLRNTMRTENTEHMKSKEDYNIASAMVYNNLFSSLEKVGDHIVNVTESIVGEI
ncbi:MAG: Na/Pi cotransporter family protein [Bacteroidota bacterium]